MKIKAAAIDMVGAEAEKRGLDVVFVDNEPVEVAPGRPGEFLAYIAYDLDLFEEGSIANLTSSIIGGTSFSGGIGTAGGTVVGAFIVGFLNNIMNLANINSYMQQIARGAIIALAVIYDIWTKNRRTRSLVRIVAK